MVSPLCYEALYQEQLDLVASSIEDENKRVIQPTVLPMTSGNKGGDDQSTEQIASPQPSGFAALDPDEKETWEGHATRIMRRYVRLVTIPTTKTALAAELSTSELGRIRGDPTGLVMIHYDVKLSGETITAPHLRVPPLRASMYDMLVQSTLAARGSTIDAESDSATAILCSGDLAVIFDGGRKGHPLES